MIDVLIRSRRDGGDEHIQEKKKSPCEDTVRKRLSPSQGERPQANPYLPTL